MKNRKKTIIVIAAIIILAAAGGGGAWMYHQAQLDKMRTAGVEALQGSVTMDEYRSAQQEEIQTILSDSEKKIMESKD